MGVRFAKTMFQLDWVYEAMNRREARVAPRGGREPSVGITFRPPFVVLWECVNLLPIGRPPWPQCETKMGETVEQGKAAGVSIVRGVTDSPR